MLTVTVGQNHDVTQQANESRSCRSCLTHRFRHEAYHTTGQHVAGCINTMPKIIFTKNVSTDIYIHTYHASSSSRPAASRACAAAAPPLLRRFLRGCDATIAQFALRLLVPFLISLSSSPTSQWHAQHTIPSVCPSVNFPWQNPMHAWHETGDNGSRSTTGTVGEQEQRSTGWHRLRASQGWGPHRLRG